MVMANDSERDDAIEQFLAGTGNVQLRLNPRFMTETQLRNNGLLNAASSGTTTTPRTSTNSNSTSNPNNTNNPHDNGNNEHVNVNGIAARLNAGMNNLNRNTRNRNLNRNTAFAATQNIGYSNRNNNSDRPSIVRIRVNQSPNPSASASASANPSSQGENPNLDATAAAVAAALTEALRNGSTATETDGAAALNPANQNSNQNVRQRQSHTQQQSQSQTQSQTQPRYRGRLRFNSHLIPLSSQNILHQSAASLPPLEEQPAPTRNTNTNTNSNTNTNTNKEEEQFEKELECGICYEIIDIPSHCGSCAARYCQKCLRRAILQSKSCPSCRKSIPSPSDIHTDAHFFQTLTLSHPGKTRPCPHINCTLHLPPSQIRSHDATCAYKPMMCKYTPYGCPWTGPRLNLSAHYKIGCPLHKLSPLLQELRLVKSTQKHTIDALGMRLVQERQVSMSMVQQMLALQRKQWNLWDLGCCVCQCSCQPRRFLVTALVWKNFWSGGGMRAAVNNFVCLVPIVVWVLKHSIKGVGYFTKVLDGLASYVNHGVDVNVNGVEDALVEVGGASDVEHDGGGDGGLMEIYLLEMVLTYCTFILGGLFLACFFMDNRCPFGWSQFSVKRGPIDITHPILRDSAIISSAFLHFICSELENHQHGFNYKGACIAILVQFAMFFHPIVQAMLTVAAEEPLSGANLFRTGRAFGIIQFGIIYGNLFVFFDPLPVVEGIWIYMLVADAVARSVSQKVKHEQVFRILKTVIGDRICGSVILLHAFTDVVTLTTMEQILEYVYTIVIARSPTRILVLLIILAGNYVASWVQCLGEKIGRSVSQNALRDLQTQPHDHGRQHYNGALCFIVWASMLSSIALV